MSWPRAYLARIARALIAILAAFPRGRGRKPRPFEWYWRDKRQLFFRHTHGHPFATRASAFVRANRLSRARGWPWPWPRTCPITYLTYPCTKKKARFHQTGIGLSWPFGHRPSSSTRCPHGQIRTPAASVVHSVPSRNWSFIDFMAL